jgi:hemoglobin/transferrin/lactoferrin receptor protein
MLAVWRGLRYRDTPHYTTVVDHRLARSAATLLFGLAAAAGRATAPDISELETVTVVGKRPEPLQQAAAAVSVISSAQIEALVAFDLGDVLRREPAVSVPGDPQRFGDNGITVRGLGGNRVHIETDGVPAAEGFAVGSFSDAGRRLADLELVERVELLRGPASALYGSDAIAGVLAITTLDPADLLDAGAHALLRARAGYADDDGSTLLGLTGALRAGPVEGLVGFAHREAGAVDHAGGAPPPNPRDLSSDTLLARALFGQGDRPLRVTAQWNRERVRTDVDALELSDGRFANTVLLEGDDRLEAASFLVDQDFGGTTAFDHALWRAFWRETDYEQRTHEERRAVPPALPALSFDREFRYQERTTGAELTLGRELATGTGTHVLLGGIELQESRVTERRDGLQTDLATGESTSTILGESLPVRDFPISRIREAGVYLQDDWRPGGGSWSLIPAVRADWYRLEPQVDAMYAEDNPSEPPVSIEETSVSPKLGVARRLGGGTTAYLQYAHGFRAPPFDDVNIGLDLPQFNVRAIPNPELRSERSDSVELGIRFSDGAVGGSAAVFAARYRDFIESRVNIGVDPGTGTTLFQSRNLASAEIAGVEAAIDIALEAWHPALTGFTGHLSGSWTDGEDRSTGEPINSIDPPRGILGVRWESPGGGFGAGLELTVVGGKHDVDESAGPLFRPDGYSVLDLRLQWRPGARFTAGLGLFNLADSRYHEWASVRGVAPDDPLLPLYREAGRNYAVTLTATFD